MNSNPFKENEEKAEQVLRECGLPPERSFIAQFRTLLEQETANEERAGRRSCARLRLLLGLTVIRRTRHE